MGIFLEKLDTKIADELRYAVGMLCLYRERERQYSCDLDIARLRRDDTRAGEIEADLASFRSEMMRIVITERSARTRLRLQHGDAGFPHRPFRFAAPDERDGDSPIGGLTRIHSDAS